MIGSSSTLVLFHVVTAGKNGAEDLGTDESLIVQLVYLLYDLANNKVSTMQQHYVRPSINNDYVDSVLTDECRAATGMQPDSIRNALPVDGVLEEMERFFRGKGMHGDQGGSGSFCFCTDGPNHMRLVLHPAAANQHIDLPPHYYRYFDLRKEFTKTYSVSAASLHDVSKYLGLEEDICVDYGVRKVQEMARIVERLLQDGHRFTEPEVIKDKLEPGICNKSDYVEDDTVIRARGLPWQSSDQDVARFFRGLNIARGGVALCLSAQGRRNGEALIRFEDRESRDLALRKHKHHLGMRYIEVYKASGKDFLNVAGGSNTEAQAFLSRGAQAIIRMRGLPYTATPDQVIDFFRRGERPVEVLGSEAGILFVHQADGRTTGDAFVLFASEEDGLTALSKHRELIGTRYIELFKSTTAEVQQVLNRSMDPQPQTMSMAQADVAAAAAAVAAAASLPSLLGQMSPQPLPVLPQQLLGCRTSRDCIRLRGLPFEASVTDILTFLGDSARSIVYQGVHLVFTAQGAPSGEAFIQMDSELAAETAALQRHKKYMAHGNKKRYVEVFQCSGADMNLVLTHGDVPALNPAAAVASMAGPAAPALAIPMMQRATPLLSPGHTTMLAAYGSYPYAAAQQLATSHHLQPQMALAAASQASLVNPGLSQLHAAAAAAAAAANQATRSSAAAYYPQLVYWYPSPPVSPQSYYGQQGPAAVVMRGLPFTVSEQDIVNFFEGFYDLSLDCVQIQRGVDGRPNGDAIVTFSSRLDAERAAVECHRKILGNRYVELFIA